LFIIAFSIFYRFAEAQLIKMVAPFLWTPARRAGLD
jgi:PAT family beta-lactamase induction signal transducer AmpG